MVHFVLALGGTSRYDVPLSKIVGQSSGAQNGASPHEPHYTRSTSPTSTEVPPPAIPQTRCFGGAEALQCSGKRRHLQTDLSAFEDTRSIVEDVGTVPGLEFYEKGCTILGWWADSNRLDCA